mgnify:CR=1 FL=1
MNKMTVAAALRRIKKLKGEIATLDMRIKQSACHLEDKEPPFSYGASMEERTKKVMDLSRLQTVVAVSNATTSFQYEGLSILVVGAVKHLEEIKAKIALLNGLPIRDRVRDVEVERVNEWSDEHERAVTRTTEKVHLSSISRAQQAEQIASLTSQFETLNVALEACNHSTFIEV